MAKAKRQEMKTKFKRIRKGLYISTDGKWTIEQPGPNWSFRLYLTDDSAKTIVVSDRLLCEVKRLATLQA